LSGPGEIDTFQQTCLALAEKIGSKDALKKAMETPDMSKRFDELDKYLNSESNNKNKPNNNLLAEFLSGHDSEHAIFVEKDDTSKPHQNAFNKYFTKVAEDVKKHRFNEKASDK